MDGEYNPIDQPTYGNSAGSHRSDPVNQAESPEFARDLEKLEELADQKQARLLSGSVNTSSFTSQIHVSPEDENGATVTSVTLNLIGGGLGTGILSMPWGMAGGSILLSLGVLALVLGVNAFTIMILVYAGDKYQQFELGCLLAMLPGKRLPYWSQIISNCLVWATLWGVIVGYCIVIQTQIVPFMPEDNSTLTDKKLWAAAGTALAIPLCFLNTKYLSFTSGLSVFTNMYLFCVLIALTIDGLDKTEKEFCVLGFGPGIVTFSSTMQYGVIIQFCVLPMYKEMKDRRPAAFGKALAISFTFLFCLFSIFAVVGYMCFGPTVEQDILDDYPSIHDSHKTSLNIPANVAKIGMVLVVLGVYPLMMMPMISPVREFERRVLLEAAETPRCAESGESHGGCITSLQRIVLKSPKLLSTGAVFLIGITACVCSFKIDKLGELNAVSGAAQASFFVGIFPALIAWYLLEKKESTRWRNGLVFLTFASCSLSLMGFIFIDNQHAKLDGDACIWRGHIGSNS